MEVHPLAASAVVWRSNPLAALAVVWRSRVLAALAVAWRSRPLAASAVVWRSRETGWLSPLLVPEWIAEMCPGLSQVGSGILRLLHGGGNEG